MSRRLLSFQTKVIAFLMGLLGFSACSDTEKDDENVVMYGTPTAQFVVKGSVINKNEQPIQNIKTVIEVIYRDTEGKILSHPLDSVQTNTKGEFEITKYTPSYNSRFAMRFEDSDGEANGSYQTEIDTIQFKPEDFKSEGVWQSTATKNMGKIVLKDKGETTEEPK